MSWQTKKDGRVLNRKSKLKSKKQMEHNRIRKKKVKKDENSNKSDESMDNEENESIITSVITSLGNVFSKIF